MMGWLSHRRWTSCVPLMLFFLAALQVLGHEQSQLLDTSLQPPFSWVSEPDAGDRPEVQDLLARADDICGYKMRTPQFVEQCKHHALHFHWDGKKETVDEGTKVKGIRPEDAQCDHIVELQWIQNHINSDQAAVDKCKAIRRAKLSGTPHPDGQRLYETIAGATNAMYVSTDINRLKGLYNNYRTSEKALRNKRPHHTLATADYVAKTRGRAVKVMDGVNDIFPTLKAKYTTKEKLEEAEKQATRSFDTHIGAHINQLIADCKKNAADCAPSAPASDKKRPTTPETASKGNARNKAKGPSTAPTASSNAKERTAESASASTRPSSSRVTRSSAAKQAAQGSGCNSLKRSLSLCRYRPKGASSAVQAKASAKTQPRSAARPAVPAALESWSSRRKAAMSTLPRNRKSQEVQSKSSMHTTASGQHQRKEVSTSPTDRSSRLPSWSEQRKKALAAPRSRHGAKSQQKSIQGTKQSSSSARPAHRSRASRPQTGATSVPRRGSASASSLSRLSGSRSSRSTKNSVKSSRHAQTKPKAKSQYRLSSGATNSKKQRKAAKLVPKTQAMSSLRAVSKSVSKAVRGKAH